MIKLLGILCRSLLSLAGTGMDNNQKQAAWNQHAEFSCLVSGDSLPPRELTFRKDSITLSVRTGKEDKSVSCAFKKDDQEKLSASLDKNKFFSMHPGSESNGEPIQIIFTYTKDHFRKQVFYSSSKYGHRKLKSILRDIHDISKANGLEFLVPEKLVLPD